MNDAPHSDLLIKIGRLEAGLAAVKEDSAQTRQDVRETRQDVREIRDTIAGLRGGWKALIAVGAIAGMAGAALLKIGPWLWTLPK